MATFVSNESIKDYYAAFLGESDAVNLQPRMDVLVPRANVAAYNAIRGKLADRGFTTAQVDQWDQREEFNLDLACCFLLRSPNSGLESDLWTEKFCRLAELDELPITIDGELVTPAGDGAIGYGDMVRTDDTFSRTTNW